MNRPWLKTAARLGFLALRTAAVVYLLVLLLLLFLENTLLYPAPKYPEGDWDAAYLPHEDVSFTSADGTKLHGWLVEHPQPRAWCCICTATATASAISGRTCSSFAISTSSRFLPSTTAATARAKARRASRAFWKTATPPRCGWPSGLKTNPTDIVLMGRSLGGGVAVDLAANNGARGLILQSTFTSLPDAAACIYPWCPRAAG